MFCNACYHVVFSDLSKLLCIYRYFFGSCARTFFGRYGFCIICSEKMQLLLKVPLVQDIYDLMLLTVLLTSSIEKYNTFWFIRGIYHPFKNFSSLQYEKSQLYYRLLFSTRRLECHSKSWLKALFSSWYKLKRWNGFF